MPDENGAAGRERGPYLTGNRARELEHLVADLERRLTSRMDDLERDQRETKRLARQALAAPVEFARREVGALLEGIKAFTETGGRT